MSKIQTRRTVALSAKTYDAVKAYCELYSLSMSSFIEARIKDALDAQPENLLDQGFGVAEERAVAPCLCAQPHRVVRSSYRIGSLLHGRCICGGSFTVGQSKRGRP